MKRHAAALALVGWYLIFPPIVCEKNRPPVQEGNATTLHQPCEPDASRPISEWTIAVPFDTAEACLQKVQEFQDGTAAKKVGEKAEQKDPGIKNWLAGGGLADAQCVATDDPRLRK